MRKRLFSALGGAMVGMLISPPLRDAFGLSTVAALTLCAGAGIIFGYVISAAVDVFSERTDEG